MGKDYEPRLTWFIVVVGNVQDGFIHYGPFRSRAECYEYMDKQGVNPEYEGQVVPLNNPNKH